MKLTELFRHQTDLTSIPAGKTLLNAGEHGDVMYVLMSGNADVVVNGKVVEEAEPGALLGEMSLIDGSTHSAMVVAKTDCQVLPITRERFVFLIQQTPNFALHVMKVMAGRLRKTDSYL